MRAASLQRCKFMQLVWHLSYSQSHASAARNFRELILHLNAELFTDSMDKAGNFLCCLGRQSRQMDRAS